MKVQAWLGMLPITTDTEGENTERWKLPCLQQYEPGNRTNAQKGCGMGISLVKRKRMASAAFVSAEAIRCVK